MNHYPIIAPAIPSGQVYQFVTPHEVEYEVRFGRKKENILHSVVVFGVLNDEYEGEEYVVTNKGDALRVMTTIAEVIRMYLKEHPNMQIVEFTGILREDDKSEHTSQRTKLYARFLPKVFPGNMWSTEITGNRILARRLK
ncbi:MAG: hypothetical protein ACI8ZM_001918 [Crocinitomix sp.]|jgi:hypothetical protein